MCGVTLRDSDAKLKGGTRTNKETRSRSTGNDRKASTRQVEKVLVDSKHSPGRILRRSYKVLGSPSV